MKKQKIQYASCVGMLALVLMGCQPTVTDSEMKPVAVDEEPELKVEPKLVETPPDIVIAETSVEDVFHELDHVSDALDEPDVLDSSFIKERYLLYRSKELQWQNLIKETASLGVGFEQSNRFVACFKLVSSLSQGYQGLQDGSGDGYFTTSRYDISFLTDDCDTVFGIQAIYLPTMLGVFKSEMVSQGREIVYYYNAQQDYARVLLAIENLQELTEDPLSLELNRIYGTALVKMGRLDDAAKALALVVDGFDSHEQWPLRLDIAELLIASGEYEKARNQYLAIAEVLSGWDETHKIVTDQLALLYATDDHTTEIALYSQCLHAFLVFDGISIPVALEQNLRHLQGKYPNGIHTDAALRLYHQVEEQTRNSVELRLLDIQKIANANKFQQALEMLKELQEARLPEDTFLRITEVVSLVAESHKTYIQQEKDKRAQVLADRWQEGLNLLDMQMYDESILVFSELLGTEYDSRAVEQIEKGSSSAAVALRKQAANLFVRARRTQDYNGRITFLNQSRRLLQEILDKYPQVDLAEKVAVNLAVIDAQLFEMGVSSE